MDDGRIKIECGFVPVGSPSVIVDNKCRYSVELGRISTSTFDRRRQENVNAWKHGDHERLQMKNQMFSSTSGTCARVCLRGPKHAKSSLSTVWLQVKFN